MKTAIILAPEDATDEYKEKKLYAYPADIYI